MAEAFPVTVCSEGCLNFFMKKVNRSFEGLVKTF